MFSLFIGKYLKKDDKQKKKNGI